MNRYGAIVLMSLFLFSCGHVISKEVRKQAIREVSFSKILENPTAYENNVFIFGGIISGTKNSERGTEIKIVQSPLDRYGYFIDRDFSEGRFIALTSKMLDPLIYKEGRTITLAGRLIGTRTGMLGDLEYAYPLIDVLELYLWKEERYYWPDYYYDPYYYSPYYIPYPSFWYYPSRHRFYGPYPWYW